MPLDGLSVHALRLELTQRLTNARVMKVFQPWPDTVILHLRVGHRTERLLLSTFAQRPSAHLTELQPENPLQAPTFAMVLRKHLEPARLLRVEQVGLDRILGFTFEAFDERGQRTERVLVSELTGRVSNLILVDGDEQRIIDALRRGDSLGRSLMPGAAYSPPSAPAQERQNPFDDSREQVVRYLRLAAAPKRLSRVLMDRFDGFGPFAAEEVLLRAGLDPQVTRGDLSLEQLEQVADAAFELITRVRDGALEPTLFLSPGGLDCWILPPSAPKLPTIRTSSSISEMCDAVFNRQHRAERVKKAQSGLTKGLRRLQKRAERKLTERLRERSQAEEAERYRHFGDLLSANLHLVQPRTDSVQVPDYLNDQAPVTIPLDSMLTPVQNIQAYYKTYQRAKRAATELAHLIEEARMEAQYLAQLIASIELAESEEELEAIAQELSEQGLLPTARREKGKARRAVTLKPRRFESSDGLTMWVGRNNKQNDQLTLKTARPSDLWFHTKEIPGSHVIVRVEGSVSPQTIEEAAILAAYYSKARESANVPVDYVERRHVRKPPGSPPGFVIYDHHKTVYVTPSEERVHALVPSGEQPAD